jgi:hypothetical protein
MVVTPTFQSYILNTPSYSTFKEINSKYELESKNSINIDIFGDDIARFKTLKDTNEVSIPEIYKANLNIMYKKK